MREARIELRWWPAFEPEGKFYLACFLYLVYALFLTLTNERDQDQWPWYAFLFLWALATLKGEIDDPRYPKHMGAEAPFFID